MENLSNVSFKIYDSENNGTVTLNGVNITDQWNGFVAMLDIGFKASVLDSMCKTFAQDEDCANDFSIQILSALDLKKLPETKLGAWFCDFMFTSFIGKCAAHRTVEFYIE